MKNEQQLLLQRLANFKARQAECLVSKFCPASWENFQTAEQIHVHYAFGQCKAEYIDAVEFWLHSLFNFLEDRFEDDQFEKYAMLSQWNRLSLQEALETVTTLSKRVQAANPLDLKTKHCKAFQMLCSAELIAILIEAEEGYYSFFWHAATD